MKSKSKSRSRINSFSELVRTWREARGLSRPEAARKLGVPYRTIQDWELGLHAPRGIALQLITLKLVRKFRR